MRIHRQARSGHKTDLARQIRTPHNAIKQHPLHCALIAAIIVAACRPSVGTASGNPAEMATTETPGKTEPNTEQPRQAETDSLWQQASAQTGARTGHNSLLYCPTPISDLIEYNLDNCYVSTIRKAVDFGKGLGDGELIISFEDDGPHFIVKLRGREILNEPRGNMESTLAAYDFDGDGRKEVFYQNGDEFSLTVYGFKGRKLEKLGSVTCNNGLIITDDGPYASTYGSQGLCDMFWIKDGKIEFSEGECIDPLLFSSDDFRNLRYSDCSTLNVPSISLSNVPGVSE